ncbi:MAG: cyclic nucleotide-binding/CBS domain-containing protein [Nitrospinales bacterium]
MDQVKYYMDESIISIDTESSVSEAARKMRDNKVGSLLIEEKGKFTGVISEGDLTRKVLAEGLDPGETKVSAVISNPIIVIDCEISMVEAFLHMRKHNIRHIVVTEKKKIAGVLSIKDFATYYINKISREQSQ